MSYGRFAVFFFSTLLCFPSTLSGFFTDYQNHFSNLSSPDEPDCRDDYLDYASFPSVKTSSVGFSIQAPGFATESPFSMPLNVSMRFDQICPIGENLEESLKTKFVEGLISDTKLQISSVILCVDHVLPPLGMKATNMIQSDEPVRSEGTNNKMSVLTSKELKFGIVHVNTHQSRYIHVINPSNQPVYMELLIFEQDLIIECQNLDKILYLPTFLNSQITPLTYGFSIPKHAVTKAYVRPHEKAVLGPVVFHPSNRCAWTSQVYILNDVSNAEWMFLRASGGLPVLVLFNGSDPVDTVKLGQRSVQALFAKNTGELPVEVKSISVMGAKCEWDGFVVNDCNGFRLLPGEQRKLEISFRADFCKVMVRLEIQIVTSGGILVVPVEVRFSTPMLTICERSLFWTRFKKSFLVALVSIVIIVVSGFRRDGNLPKMSAGQEECSSDVCPKPLPVKSTQPSLPVCPTEPVRPKPKTLKIRQSLLYSCSKPKRVKTQPTYLPETAKEVAIVEAEKPEKQGSGLLGRLEATSSSSHISNSTPSSPLSPPSSLTPELSPSQDVRSRSPVNLSTIPLLEVGPSAAAESPRPQVVDLSDPRYEYSIWDDHLRVVPNLPEGSFFAFFGNVNNTNENQ